MVTSKYAKGVLITTIIAIIIFAIPNLFAIPTALAAGEVAGGIVDPEYAGAVDAAINLVVFILVIILIVGAFAIIAGFLLALKGKWCLGCIVLSIIIAAYEFFALISTMSGDDPSAGAVLLAVANTANFTVMAVMAIKMKPELY